MGDGGDVVVGAWVGVVGGGGGGEEDARRAVNKNWYPKRSILECVFEIKKTQNSSNTTYTTRNSKTCKVFLV